MSGRLLDFTDTNKSISVTREELGSSIQKDDDGNFILYTKFLDDLFREKLKEKYPDIRCVLTYHGGK